MIGHELDRKTTTVRKVGESPEKGKVEAHTFAELVSTANARLFRIRDQVEDRYPPGPDGVMTHLRENEAAAGQLGLSFPSKPSNEGAPNG